MKQQEKTEMTRQRILAAALVEFGKNGYAGASLNNVCAAGIPKGLVYHNYKNRDEVYLACVEHCFSALTAYLKTQAPADLHGYLAARMDYFRQNPAQERIFFEALLQPPQPLLTQIEALRAEFDAFNLQIYRRVVAGLTLRPGVTGEDALAYFTLMQSVFNASFSASGCAQPLARQIAAHESALARVLDFMLYGIAEKEIGK
jgi:AcrR family transcriptional regulator